MCTLSFDEIHLSDQIEIDTKLQKIYRPSKTCQVEIVRSLFSNWKQPIYFKNDQPPTTDIVQETISTLYKRGYTVVTFNSDMCRTNTCNWKKWNIGTDETNNCYFPHPENDNLKVFVFADAPHLLKLIRNHYLDSGFRTTSVDESYTCLDNRCRESHVNGVHHKKPHI